MYNIGDIIEINGTRFIIKRCISEDIYYISLVHCPIDWVEANKTIENFVEKSFGIFGGMHGLIEYVQRKAPEITYAYTGNWDSPDFKNLEMLNVFIEYLQKLVIIKKIKLLN